MSFETETFLRDHDARLVGRQWPLENWYVDRHAVRLQGNFLDVDLPLEWDPLNWELDPRHKKQANLERRKEGRNRESEVGLVKATPSMLEQFAALADAPPEAFAKFATRYGPLFLCKHGVPRSHGRPSQFGGQCRGMRREPISQWRTLATIARSAVIGAASLHRGEIPAEPDRWILSLAEDALDTIENGDSPSWQKHTYPGMWRLWQDGDVGTLGVLLAAIVTRWISLANVLPALVWYDRTAPSVVFLAREEARLFGSLGVLLAAVISRTSGLSVCSGCGKAYNPEIRARAGRRRYCDRCRRLGVPQRDASHDWRQRQRSETKRRPRS